VINASAKASTAIQKICSIMPNISAATTRKRRLLGNLVHSLLLFGTPIWADRMSAKGTAEMVKVQRKTALRVVSAYCTVSTLVLASMPPIDLLPKNAYTCTQTRTTQKPEGRLEISPSNHGKHGGISPAQEGGSIA